MTSIETLLTDTAAMIGSCPEVVTELDGDTTAVQAYLDEATTRNSLAGVVYRQPNGSVLVAWLSTSLSQGEEMAQWAHQVEIYARACRQKSPLNLINAIIDGIPAGTDLRWRYQCVNDTVLPVDITEIARVVDEEGIDYYVIRTVFTEKGDT